MAPIYSYTIAEDDAIDNILSQIIINLLGDIELDALLN